MGVFCGFIAKNQEQFDTKARVKNAFLKRYAGAHYYEDDYSFFGIVHSDVTLQSVYECGPVIDKEQNLVVIADAELDNRNELFNKLQISRRDISDSELILLAYKKWGEQCAKQLIGEFSFCVYNTITHCAYCVRDQLGTRNFYYTRNNNLFAFSTAMTNLFPTSQTRFRLNDSWIALFLSVVGPFQDYYSTQTVYDGIMQLDPAHFLIEENKKFHITKYWAANIHNKTSYTFSEACDGVREVLTTAIQDKIKSKHNVGSYLSGGLDSGSICTIASKLLKAENKQLYTYSSIPSSKYKLEGGPRVLNDESEYIRAIVQNDDNIVHKFIDSDGKSSITDIEKNLEYMEHPYKFVENMFWLDNIAEIAKNDGCKVLLEGTFGNCTVSYGIMFAQLLTLVQEGRFGDVWRDITDISNLYHAGKKRIIYEIIKYGMPILTPNYLRDRKMDYSYLPVNKEFAQKHRVESQIRELKIEQFYKSNMSVYDYRKFYMWSASLAQVNVLKSAFNNQYGLQLKDPTLDIRVIDFCFSVPYEYYVRGGRERELFREAMKGILPDKVRLNYELRGRQGADWTHRLEQSYEVLKKELIKLLNNDKILYYVDGQKLKDIIINTSKESFMKLNKMTIRMLVISLIFCKFIADYENLE